MSFAAQEQEATCARCSFAEPVLAPKTYALALLTGNQDATRLWQLELEKSAQAPTPPLHTFCVQCRQSSWVARRATAQEALAAHLAESALWHEVWHNFCKDKQKQK
jgi:hypothetical protein